jgi:hypothetical protein
MTCKKFSVVLATNGFQPNAIPYLQLNLGEQPDAVAQIFSFITQQDFNVFASTWMRVPPDVMDNPFGALHTFYMPKSFLEKKVKMFLLIKDETKATAHAMPDDICGFTDILDDALRKIL